MMPGPPPVVTTSQKARQAAGVLVVTSHVNRRLGALQIFSLFRGSLCGGGIFLTCIGKQTAGVIVALDPSRSEEDDRVLNLLAAETRQRLAILGQQPQYSAIWTIQKRFILISQRS
jgi:hypothetical protein